MKVAVLYSGGKDSAHAIDYALRKGWEIQYLISVKPNRTDCFLFHFATVEHTPKVAEALGMKHFLLDCTVADPSQEAALVKAVIEKNPVDAVVLGGVGLQETQLGSLQKALMPLGTEVFASHAGEDEEEIMRDMISRGFRIIITQFATDGLTMDWLGKELTLENFEKLKKLSQQYGFDLLGEGGYYDTFVIDAPYFPKAIQFVESHKVQESKYSGHLIVTNAQVVEKITSKEALFQ